MYYLIFQFFYFYILYLIFNNFYIYLYNILCFILMIILVIFLSCRCGDFFSSLIFLVELLVFLLICLFSFFNNTWIKQYKINSFFFFFFLVLVFSFLNISNYYYNIYNLFIFRYIFSFSDLIIFFYGFFFSSYYIYIVFVYFIVFVGLFILFILKPDNKFCNFFRIIKFQNNFKQNWRYGGIRLIRSFYRLVDRTLDFQPKNSGSIPDKNFVI